MLRLVSCLAALTACTDLTAATSDVCGNGAIDPGEDCDGNAASGQACGAAGDANACHFVCTAGAACPTGFACGVDERCRAPSGTFALGGGPFPFVVSTFRAGDVDGDGIADLIGLVGTHAEIRHGNAAADFSNVTDQLIPASSGNAIIDLDGDGRTDVLLASSLGMVTMLGAQDGFDQHPYSSISLDSTITGDLRVHQVHPLAGLDADLLLLYDTVVAAPPSTVVLHEQLAYPGSNFATCFNGDLAVGDSCNQGTTMAMLLGNDVAIGRTGYVWTCAQPFGTSCDSFSASDPTDEVAVAVQGATAVTLLSATEQLKVTIPPMVPEPPDPKTAALAHVQDINMPALHPVATDGRMMFADFDGDHCDDLAIPVVTGTTISLAVAYNTGCTGKLADAVLIKAPTNLTNHSFGIPRLYADLNGDGIADLVTDQQIFFANCAPTCGTQWKGTGVAVPPREWTTVIATDINSDGHIDIAGFVDGEADVDVLLNGGDGTFARFTILTDLPVRSIRSGDFDGDLYQDIAIVGGDASSSDEDDEISIAYGAPSGGPSAPVSMGTYGVIHTFDSALIETSPGDPEGISDLLVVTDHAPHRSGAVMVGSTSRQVIAPFEIDIPANANPLESPAVLVAGDFDSAAGIDVAQVSLDGSVSLMSGIGGGDVALGVTSMGTPFASILKAHISSVFTHGALSAGSVESVIGFSSPTTAVAGSPPTCPVTSALMAIPDADGKDWTSTMLGDVTIPGLAPSPPNCQRIHAVTTHDVDGDGVIDFLVQLCDGTACNLGGFTAVAYGGGGTLDVPGAKPIPTNGLVCGRFTPIAVTATGAPELIAPCLAPVSGTSNGAQAEQEAFLVMFAAGTRQLAEVARFPIPSDTDLRLTVGDFNGDHLDDIAITSGAANETVVTLYLQCAAGDPSCAAIEQVKP